MFEILIVSLLRVNDALGRNGVSDTRMQFHGLDVTQTSCGVEAFLWHDTKLLRVVENTAEEIQV